MPATNEAAVDIFFYNTWAELIILFSQKFLLIWKKKKKPLFNVTTHQQNL